MLVFNEKHILCQPNTENTKSVENTNFCENPLYVSMYVCLYLHGTC